MRILTVPAKNTETFTLLVLVGAGSKYETKKINGISHFLEHMFFKGTRSRPEPGQVNRELDGIGAQHNAFTSKEVTGYWVKAAREHFDLALGVVSDILTEPLLSESEIEKEKGVIVQEIQMRNDDPMSRVGMIFENLLWGNQPAGWEIAGDEKTVKSLKRQDVVDYFYSQYAAKNTVVVASGSLPKNIETKIIKAFSSLRHGHVRPKKKTIDEQKHPAILLETKEVEASNFVLGFRGFNMWSRERFALDMLGIILGGNSSSRLWMEIREKLGLAYYVGAGNTLYTDSGYFEISAGVPHKKVGDVISIILTELKKIKSEGVHSVELKKASDYLHGSSKISFENSSSLASFFGEQEVFNKKILTPGEYLKKVDKVTAGEIRALANVLFLPNKINLAVVGQGADKIKLEKLLKLV